MDLDDQGIGRVEAQAPTGPKQHRRSPSAGGAAAASSDASAVDSRTPAGEQAQFAACADSNCLSRSGLPGIWKQIGCTQGGGQAQLSKPAFCS